MSEVLAWLAAGAIDQIGDLPGDDRPGDRGHDPVFTVPSEPLRRDLTKRLASIGKTTVVLSPLHVRSFLMRAWLNDRTVDKQVDGLDLAAMLEEAANGVIADVEATLRLAEEEARMEATEQGEPTGPDPEPEPEREPEANDAESSLTGEEQVLFGDGAEEPVCFGFDDLTRALGDEPAKDDTASESDAATPVDEMTPAAAEASDEPAAEPAAAANDADEKAGAPSPSALCDREANSFLTDLVREVESKRQQRNATPVEIEPAPPDAEEPVPTADAAVAADEVEATLAAPAEGDGEIEVESAVESEVEVEVEGVVDGEAQPAAELVPDGEPMLEAAAFAESATEDELQPEATQAAVAVVEEVAPAPVEGETEPESTLVTATANEGTAELVARSMDRIESFLGQLQGALVELAQRPAASVDVAPLVQAVRDGFEQSTQLAMTTSNTLSNLGTHVDQLGARVEQGVGRVVQSLLEQAAPDARQHSATEFVGVRTSRMPIVFLAFATLVIAWSILFWIKTGSSRLALGTLIGGNLIGCCLLGYGRAR